MSTPIADSAQRATARNPELSVIVQAPAGSGKTELLMQRCLALLARAHEPEEILAVTFTRKAAAEMRLRILKALWPAPGDKERLPETAELAEQVLQQNESRGWRLQEFPGRLRIRTLDSVNAWLTGSAPVSGEGSAMGAVTEHPEEYYELAARRTIEQLGEGGSLGADLDTILGHLDNRADQFIALMAGMLQRRDQWLPLIGAGELSADSRDTLEAGLHGLVSQQLKLASASLPHGSSNELLALLPYAAGQLQARGKEHAVLAWSDCTEFPLPVPEQIELWRALAKFCLISDGSAFRKPGGLNVGLGFPTAKDGGDDTLKQRAKDLFAAFAEDDTLLATLQRVAVLPDPCYSDTQWEALRAMIRVLPVVAAQLLVVFRERGQTDYVELASEALQALDAGDGPSELALRLDYQIRHILIDEFQDTSVSQVRLLEALTEGWEPDDGRTLFVVGDPMQSIYRFRQAEVALFDQLRSEGIGNLQLTKVQLTTNFRSEPGIVEWVNETFGKLMPTENNPSLGAVQFAEGTPSKTADNPDHQAVHWHPAVFPARVDEAREIADLVEQALAESDAGEVGILVRTRNQARLIVPELRRRGIPFLGEGLERPGETAVEQDLIALTRALCHLGDRCAWLALLRAPWCGLSLADLELLTGDPWDQAVWEQMADPSRVAKLSADGQQRVGHLHQVLAAIFDRRSTQRLRDWIEGAWQQLAGPAALRSAHELKLARQFFGVLDEYEEGGNLTEAFLLHERLADRVDEASDTGIRVHVLTLFKAKGLEYDTVILPSLDSAARGDSKDAVAWHNFIGADGRAHFLLAPVEPVGADADPLHTLIRQFKKEQAAFELDRFLYVATTRAKKQLHMFLGLRRNSKDEISAPAAGTLLQRLWPVVGEDYLDFAGEPGTPESRDDWLQPLISRFPPAWHGVAAPAAVVSPEPADKPDSEPEVTFDWAGSDAMRVGLVVHRCLQYLATNVSADEVEAKKVSAMLAEEGVAAERLDEAVAKVTEALHKTRENERGAWILAHHQDAASEFPVTVLQDGRPRRYVIDRTFVDEHGERWIIDYKTSSHQGGNLEAFLASEQTRYAEQLSAYRDALQLLEPERRIRLALYFPLLGEFREFGPQPAD